MTKTVRSLCLLFSLYLSALTSALAEAEAVQALLNDRCIVCHQGAAAPLGLSLETLDGLVKGSSNGAVIVPGDPETSELMLRIRGTSLPRMPMTGPPWLSAEEEAMISDWIAAGAPTLPASSTVSDSTANANARAKIDAALRGSEPVTWLDVAPVFAQRCAKCHTRDGLMGPAPEGFLLTSLADTLTSIERARVIPGNPEGSELLRRVRGLSLPRMPFDGPPYLDADEISLIERWIREGARDSEGAAAAIPIGASVRFQGTLTSPNQIDDATFRLDAGTRIDKPPRPGQSAELRARVGEDGGLVATRLRRR